MLDVGLCVYRDNGQAENGRKKRRTRYVRRVDRRGAGADGVETVDVQVHVLRAKRGRGTEEKKRCVRRVERRRSELRVLRP